MGVSSTSKYSWSQLCVCGPIYALTMIGAITTATVFCHLMWWPLTSGGAVLHLSSFVSVVVLILANYFYAALRGPGFVPLGWRPPNRRDEKSLQFCEICQGFKAPRAHHCRRCQRCVLKMDHHCPWLATCLGHRNHTNFLSFLFFVFLGCFHAVFILGATLYRGWYWRHSLILGVEECIAESQRTDVYLYIYESDDGTIFCSHFPRIAFGMFSFLLCMIAAILAIAVDVAILFMLVCEVDAILKNRTGIEEWILEKAEHRYRKQKPGQSFTFPYDVGWKTNLLQVVNWELRPLGDGFVWPVKKGCHQHTLTLEQLMQKKAKNAIAVLRKVGRNYSGKSCVPGFGLRVMCSTQLCTDEPRMAVSEGEAVRITRFGKRWCYGSRVAGPGKEAEEKGWFPRKCLLDDYRKTTVKSEGGDKKK